jgi:phage/plasmid-associated DNA primase
VKWTNTGQHKLNETLAELLEKYYSSGIVSNVETYVSGNNRVKPHELGVGDGSVAFQNDIVEIESGERRDIEPEDDYVIRPLQCRYKPENAECEDSMFAEFIEDCVPDTNDRKTLQEFAGYTLLRGELPYQKAMMLVGPTNSGKSTFVRILKALLGTENVMGASLKQLTQQFSAYRLDERLLNVHPDLSGEEIDASHFKVLSGDDMSQVEQKYKDPKDIHNTAKLLFAANQTPEVANADDAFFGRWLFARFPIERSNDPTDDKPDIDRTIEQTILDGELPMVANWAIEGYQRLIERDGFTVEPSPSEARKLWYQNADPVTEFIHRQVVEVADDEPTEPLRSAEAVSALRKELVGSGKHIDMDKRTMTTRIKQHYPGHDTKNCRIGGKQEKAFPFLRLQPVEGDDSEM